jgi:hypothetical protein
MAHRIALALLALLAWSCGSGSPPTEAPVPYGNPAGYSVHVLTGASLSAREVTVNGLAVDTASVASIDASVQAIRDETLAPTTVEEVTGVAPQLTVDFTGEATRVPPTFRGANLQWRSKFFLQNPRWKALVKHLGLGLLRFPGGQERVRYDGKGSPSGTPETDTLAIDGFVQPYEFRLSGEDVARYVALCQELGIAAEPEVNLTVDDPGQAADLVSQIVNDLHYDLQYVSVGNEPDVHAARPGSPDGNWPYLGVTALDDDSVGRPQALAHYAARYLAYRQAIDAVKPGLTYALGELGDGSPGNLGAILDGIGADQPGAVAVHWYLLGDFGQLSSDPGYPSIDHLAVTGNGGRNVWALEDYVGAARAAAASRHLTAPRVFVGEFGPSWSAQPADTLVADRLAAALFNVEAQETGKRAGVDAMLWFGLSDPSTWTTWVPSLVAVDDDGTPHVRPQYYVYVLYKYLYGDETVAVPGGQDADSSLYASRGGGRRYFLFVNRTAHTRVSRVVKAVTASGDRLLRLTSYPHAVAVVEF